MCGIAGLLLAGAEQERLAAAMGATLAHRGPDDDGVWCDAAASVAFAHRRLSIVDLSPTGRQPMRSSDGRWTLVFNGEIYNHAALRRALVHAGAQLRGSSDTEAFLETVARSGLDAALEAAEGMFAFALWDGAERTLHLVRDRAGVKPLYWMRYKGGLAFASELKALQALPDVRLRLDRAGLAAYFERGYVASPRTILADVFKLAPGEALASRLGEEPRSRRYWRAEDYADAGRQSGDETRLLARLEELASASVAQEMLADVPVGCFLSGGVDSSIVAALMQRHSASPIHTFGIRFDDPGIDEAAHSQRVAQHIGAVHREVRVDAQTAFDLLARLPELCDEPIADMALIPMHAVSALARAHVKACLSGDGGDELFAGYDRYFDTLRLLARIDTMPALLRKGAASLIDQTPAPLLAQAARAAGRDPGRLPRQALRLRAALAAPTPEGVYAALTRIWPHGVDPLQTAAPVERSTPDNASPLLRLQLEDLGGYLPDCVLTKVDRAGMAVSLEVRVPLLGRRVAEFALGLPDEVKRRRGQSKWLLRQLLYKLVPRELVERPKQGLTVPMGAWLNGPLRAWAESLLARDALGESGLFDTAAIVRCWDEHKAGVVDWSYALWSVLAFESWRRRWRPEPPQ